jgi:serine/threonine protein kinase
LTVIGQGSFGKVVQARHKSTGNIYAMKILDKKNIVDRGEIEHTKVFILEANMRI